MNIDKVVNAIRNIYQQVQDDPYHIKHLMEFTEQRPEIIFKVCKDSTYPYQMFDEYYFSNNFRINKHNIIIPESIIKRIIKTNSHNGMSVLEYNDYTNIPIHKMRQSDYITAIAVHELAHVFQLYIQNYETEEQHTEEFYDVLESFYDSDLIMKMKSSIDKYL